MTFTALWAWPGAIHAGKGEEQLIVDEGVGAEQQAAVEALFNGEHAEFGATFFRVFSNVIDTYYPVLVKPVEFEADMDMPTGRFRVPGVIDATSEPIKNPITGLPHRVRVTLPQGFEYHEAEYASCQVGTGDSTIALNYENTHAHFAQLSWTPGGVVHA